MTNYNILITSDVVCPWCYIGHARLSKAIAQHQSQYPEDKFNLRYLPFYLNPPPQLSDNTAPAFPVKSFDRREYYAQKFGKDRAKQIEAMVVNAAAQDGLNFSFGGRTGITRNGHRLVYYAQTHGGEKAQNDVMLGLWKRFFEQEIDITTLDTLVDIGVEAGLGTADEVRKYLESGKDGAEVDKIAEEQRMNGISGVPNYVIQDHWEVSGAQDPAAFSQLFKRWKDMEAKGQKPVGSLTGGGDSCL